MEQVFGLFPGLADKLDGVGEHAELAVVDDFCARELVLEGASVLLGKRDIAAECAMVMWYDDIEGEAASQPKCVEFSFKYGNDDEDYRGTVARDAFELLHALPTSLARLGRPGTEDQDGLRLRLATRREPRRAPEGAWSSRTRA